MDNQYSKRDDTITMTKGVGILLMVLGHSGCPMYMIKFIYMFHVPLFFLMSGYCFKEKYLADGKTFIWRRIKGLYWPFVKWSTFFIILHNVLCYIHVNPIESSWGEHFYNGIGGNTLKMVTRLTCLEPLLGGYWFLRELFLGSLLAYLTMRLMGKFRKYSWIMLLAIAVGFREFDIVLSPNYVSISFLSFYAAAFFTFGYSIRDIVKELRPTWYGILALLFFIVLSACIYPNHEVFNQTPLFIFPYLVTSICGTVMTLLLCKLISSHGHKISQITTSFLIFCGHHSLAILTWHFLCFKFVSLIVIGIYGIPIEHLSDHPVVYLSNSVWWIVYFTVGSLLPLYIIHLKTVIRNKKLCCS